jgi:hypothetical protein
MKLKPVTAINIFLPMDVPRVVINQFIFSYFSNRKVAGRGRWRGRPICARVVG